jgi:hypothetical protein
MTNHKLLVEIMVKAAKKGVAPTEMERILRQRCRFATEDEMEKIEPSPCQWASELGRHFRVRGIPPANRQWSVEHEGSA